MGVLVGRLPYVIHLGNPYTQCIRDSLDRCYIIKQALKYDEYEFIILSFYFITIKVFH